MPLRVSSTHARRQKVKIVLYSLWYHHTYRWPSLTQVERGLYILLIIEHNVYASPENSTSRITLTQHICVKYIRFLKHIFLFNDVLCARYEINFPTTRYGPCPHDVPHGLSVKALFAPIEDQLNTPFVLEELSLAACSCLPSRRIQFRSYRAFHNVLRDYKNFLYENHRTRIYETYTDRRSK